MNIDPHFTNEELAESYRAHSTGDNVEPSTAHIESLRLLMREQTCSSDLAQNSQSKSPIQLPPQQIARGKFVWIKRIAVMAALLAVAMLSMRLAVSTAEGSFRAVLHAMRQHVWIHGTTTIEYQNNPIRQQSWCSPQQRIFAISSPSMLYFVNYEEGIQSSYTEKTNSILRWRADKWGEEAGRAFIGALLAEGDLKDTLPLHNVSPVKKTAIDVNGQARIQYAFELELKSMPAVRSSTLVNVDPQSGRIILWTESNSNEMRVATQFDYPETGPSSIYDLGAPLDAKIVDRTATSDIGGSADELHDQVVP